jgi:hypothetical protein
MKYTKQQILQAAELGEVSMIDARHIVSWLDEVYTPIPELNDKLILDLQNIRKMVELGLVNKYYIYIGFSLNKLDTIIFNLKNNC